MVSLSENQRGLVNLIVILVVGLTILGPPKGYTIDILVPYAFIALAALAAGLQKWLQDQPSPTLFTEMNGIVDSFMQKPVAEQVAIIKILNAIANSGIQTNAPAGPPKTT